MYLIKPSAEILKESEPYENAVARCAEAAALCYNADPGTTAQEREKFIGQRITTGHVSVIEHAGFTARFRVDRGITHELVRHRLASFTQESTRYCNYSKNKFGNGVTFVIPPELQDEIEEGEVCYGGGPWLIYFSSQGPDVGIPLSNKAEAFFQALATAEKQYLSLVTQGVSPQIARNILPHATKADIIVTANMREWRHIFNLRALGTTGAPHPQMVEVMNMVLAQARTMYPVFFQDL